jgi:hypothetical protein
MLSAASVEGMPLFGEFVSVGVPFCCAAPQLAHYSEIAGVMAVTFSAMDLAWVKRSR